MRTDQDMLDPQAPADDDWLRVLLAEQTAQPEPVAPAPVAPPVQSGPGAEEQRYVQDNPSPEGGWRNVLRGAMAGLADATGSSGALASFQQQQAERMKQYQHGLEGARGVDRGKQPLDTATLALLRQAGLTPEELQGTTRDSEVLKLAPSMGTVDLRRSNAENAATMRQAAIDAANERNAFNQSQQNARQDKAIAAKKKPAGLGAPMTPEQKAQKQSGLAAYLAAQANVPAAEAEAFVAGSADGIPPEHAERLQRFAAMFSQLPAKKQAEAMLDASKREGAMPDRLANQVAGKQRDPNKRMEIRNEITQSGRVIAEASQAWNSMSPSGKAAMAKLSGEGWMSNTARDLMTTEADKVAASKIQALANNLIKATSGAAVSDSEWNRLARQMGFASQSLDALKSPAAIDSWIRSSRQGWVDNKRSAVAEFGDLWKDQNAGQ
jgi:hypothetical protein